jgi:hypothetical protein
MGIGMMDDDYSLSVSDMNNSVYNSSNRGAHLMMGGGIGQNMGGDMSSGPHNMAPKFNY